MLKKTATMMVLVIGLSSSLAFSGEYFFVNCPLAEHKNAHAFMRAEVFGFAEVQPSRSSARGVLSLRLIERGHEQKTTVLSNVFFSESSFSKTNRRAVIKVVEKNVTTAASDKVSRMLFWMKPQGLSRQTTQIKMKDGRLFKTKCEWTRLGLENQKSDLPIEFKL